VRELTRRRRRGGLGLGRGYPLPGGERSGEGAVSPPQPMVRNKISLIDSRKQANQLYNEGLPWKITVNNWSIQKNTTGTTFPLYKKERERRSRAFPSDSNPDFIAAFILFYFIADLRRALA